MKRIAILVAMALCSLSALGLLGLGAPQEASAKSAEWLARDREIIRQMNLRELRKVRQREARYAAQNRASRTDQADYARRRAAYERDMAHYRAQRQDYQVRLAAWRQAVAACRAGDRSACRR